MKKQAIAQLVGLLEGARRSDTNSYERQMTDLRKQRQGRKKEQKRLASELKTIDVKKRRVLKHCERATTEDLLEVLRHRTLRSMQREVSASSTEAAPNSSEHESEE